MRRRSIAYRENFPETRPTPPPEGLALVRVRPSRKPGEGGTTWEPPVDGARAGVSTEASVAAPASAALPSADASDDLPGNERGRGDRSLKEAGDSEV